LAIAYKTEFEEMWGSNNNSPNAANAKFGADKTDNTSHIFNIDGILVELYFSPSDGTTAHIANAISSANNDMKFAMLTFINNDLGDAVIDIHNAGVDVKGIIENILYFGSEYNSLLDAGVDVLSHFTTSYFFHHKYAVIDATNPESNPCVITGSHNWTNSAEDDYDENTLIIHDAEIAGMYLEEFMARYADMTATFIAKYQEETSIFYPNPTSDFICWNNNMKLVSVEIQTLSGKSVFNCKKPSSNKISINNIPNGMYIITAKTEIETLRYKIQIFR
jgi:phosphatidylserine/phosphatidylglycerophosphate/cardiolipin synthase-like enzyme